MCGIAGMFERKRTRSVVEADMRQMLAALRHRGPDEFGILLDREIGLGNSRLSIIDLSGGSQPIANEDETLWIVFNGEVFNYIELRADLEKLGHRFRTSSDTEVILHMFEEYGPQCLNKLNGQFAIAIWDKNKRRLFLGRDRLGVRPLFYTHTSDGALVFASEIKSILSTRRIRAEIDPAIVEQVFTYWSPLSPNTIFHGIKECPPGHFLIADDQSIQIERYWKNEFPIDTDGLNLNGTPRVEEVIEEFRALLIDACRIRLRADVPVGSYLSGGLDSSTIASVVRRHTTNKLVTFSIAFGDQKFDESEFQIEMAAHLGTEHHVVRATHSEIADVFPQVIWHTEVPLMRTAPAPMFMLSKLVRDTGFKVVLTGEGADEFLAGYDIFKEAKVRRFWARQPGSKLRPQLLKSLYPDIGLAQSSASYLAAFFGEGLMEVDSPVYSHAIRWRNNRRTRRFLDDRVTANSNNAGVDEVAATLPPEFKKWSTLARAQFLEISVFLSEYLLSSQGDRMGMAHSIEGRFPFLDYRMVEFCNRLHPRLKMRGLTEKWLLKEAARPWLPDIIRRRPKRPYRAPIHRSFFNDKTPAYVREVLSPGSIQEAGLFKSGSVEQLVRKIDGGRAIGETDDMALAGIISTQLLHEQFVKNFPSIPSLSSKDRVKVCNLNPKKL
ncbi:MAG: asparagine synthase (glutamine-hydrolyzing) [Verrucomicrobia bacterium]|nr:MAG: asparagine synthase (glutamine-hydrolyzing) [Verrucomicrobiota bacterium]